MDTKSKVTLFATSFAIVLTSLIYIIPVYDRLWFALEVIILPVIYIFGYEIMMDKQRRTFGRILNETVKSAKDSHELNKKIMKENKKLIRFIKNRNLLNKYEAEKNDK